MCNRCAELVEQNTQLMRKSKDLESEVGRLEDRNRRLSGKIFMAGKSVQAAEAEAARQAERVSQLEDAISMAVSSVNQCGKITCQSCLDGIAALKRFTARQDREVPGNPPVKVREQSAQVGSNAEWCAKHVSVSTQECKHEGRKFMNVLDLPVCSECFAVTVDTSNEGDK